MKDGHPKIADFGLARELSTQSMSITFAGSPVLYLISYLLFLFLAWLLN